MDVPDEIKARAKEALWAWHNGDDTSIYEMIEQALLAQDKAATERAAKIAEHLNGWGADCGSGGHAMHIAAAIRSQP
jgi:hypothetical protein